MEFRGAFTALSTPFRDGAIDEAAYREFIEWQIEQGIDGLVPCGTTGEAATLTHEEQGRIIRICVEQVKGRLPVIAGAGSNSTKEAIELTSLAKEAGADATLQITPYYNKPTPEGLIAHFKAIADKVSIPFVIYNVPSRTGLNLLPQDLKRIVDAVPQAIAVKEATGNMCQAAQVVEYCGQGFQLLSGDDFTVIPLLSVGGQGVISVISNIMPKAMSDMCRLFMEKDHQGAIDLSLKMAPVIRAMFMETNPIPVKTALRMMGIFPRAEFRLPIVPLRDENVPRLEAVLKEAGLL
ncbi:MAG: 4-hydroxy-tetrahydrodipicolinate synthase [Pseudodesulfovibrio sp.]|uniref:4-hydroxy-tetrahydrodipicolinate synthase n=1 Tax=Pseudodesulfovibrio aespoeensis (strain ATCC 700646 / DSM 10631 / Aspo-2) TaxID=643562 RepID=E6VWJ6_PSEA9|nr:MULTISPECIES: 4-hydroxy-tetrahydrodipicolinate synthase [Pseudodesulfovibrio]MBU4378937.1 4-hydroxy-tetrahydrodipicolinate synthase [Pseudomonadota bacterium]ADU62497.1 dihydrodipicolinate synthase [Pseudodesulfovibrio aespoeensis Aspo-2]MBU4473851.1 4-hydroxy-tetrahydrodipicolinate synthase [Pseudomonadota bacterium]MBU4516606.1 4-hydroxy-tetrahydrodipicolinate synthase [Pseudomonadota bacterium]MBU4521627.1 4-hydroxy-tetrahydrodipicolinate synthase [Pseudomonadota bacterium]